MWNYKTVLMYSLTVCYKDKCRSPQSMPPPIQLIKAKSPNPQTMPPHYPQLPYACVSSLATPLQMIMTPGIQSQGGQSIGQMHCFPI